jgi:hypothetical protein
MNPHEDDRIDQRMSRFLSAAEREGPPPDEVFLARLREESTEAFRAAPADEPARPRRYRIMQWRNLKWLVPVAAAAAIVLAVGLWPSGKNGKSRTGYAFGDVPGLLGKARYLHIQGTRTLHMGTSGTGKAATEKKTQIPINDWFDLSAGARRSTTTSYRFRTANSSVLSSMKNPGPQQIVVMPADEGQMSTVETVCDGQYEMRLDPQEKTATFTRLSPLLQRLAVAQAGTTALQQLFDDPSRLGGFSLTGTETLDGITYEVWQNEAPMPDKNLSKLTRCWFSPQTGNVARVQQLMKMPFTKGEYVETMLVDNIERDTVPPPGTFDTVPPPGYTATNSKETAPVRTLKTTGPIGGTDSGTTVTMSMRAEAKTTTPTDRPTLVGAPFVRAYPAFLLPDGSVILGTSAREMSNGTFFTVRSGPLTPQQAAELPRQLERQRNVMFMRSGEANGPSLPSFVQSQAPLAPQDDLFANLTPGGELPKTPVQVYGLRPTNAQGVTYTGRHLAWTKKDGECIEWALYVPDAPPPASIQGFNLLTRMNPSEPAGATASFSMAVQAPVRIDAGNYDDLVAAAMAELNDSGTAPPDMSFDAVTRLAQQIRASLGNP